jgi:hypothetical protein
MKKVAFIGTDTPMIFGILQNMQFRHSGIQAHLVSVTKHKEKNDKR